MMTAQPAKSLSAGLVHLREMQAVSLAAYLLISFRAACARNAERVSLRRLAAASMALSIPRSREMLAETTRVSFSLSGTEIRNAPPASSAATFLS